MSNKNLPPPPKPLERQDSYEQQTEEELDIMSMLHKTKLKIIENDFALREKGLKLNEFVSVMLEHLDYERSLKNQGTGTIRPRIMDEIDYYSQEEKKKQEMERIRKEEDHSFPDRSI